MTDLFRDATVGQLIRLIAHPKSLSYPEEIDDFKCPNCYTGNTTNEADDSLTATPFSTEEGQLPIPEPAHLEKTSTGMSLEHSKTQQDLEAALDASLVPSRPERIVPAALKDGTVLVDWYTTDDQANPQNWSFAKKCFITFQICIYTTAVYMGSAIYAPAEGGVVSQFGVSVTVASLGLALYVLGYGIGPMVFAPLSEIPSIGRNPPYIISFAIFVLLSIPTALVNNITGLLILRFLQGFFGSPCLATGGATLQDMFSLIKLPYVFSLWALAATCGPAIGPTISGFSVAAESWRWALWEILWLAGPIWILLFFWLPETNPSTILLQRARRLRSTTGNPNLKSQSEIDQQNLSFSRIAIDALYVPFQLMFLDPAIAFTAVYTALIYGIYYSFFEAFPLVYMDMYGFNIGEMGLAFLSITLGVAVAISLYWAYTFYVVEPSIRAHGLGAPERRLVPALFAAPLLPLSLFAFGWLSRPSIHWIAPTLAIFVFTVGIFIVIQCIFVYLPLTYPQYAASLFAGNDLTRSTLAAAAVLFARPMFGNLGVGVGMSVLGALTAVCVGGVFVLWGFGAGLRARSRFSAK